MAINSKDADFFRPLWRRVVVTVVIAVWFGYETLFSKDQLWITITTIGLAYCVWNLLLRFPKDASTTTPPGSTGGGSPTAALSGAPDDNSGNGSPPAAPKA